MSKIIQRTQSFKFTKNEVVKALGLTWGLDNGYMDADPIDDIYCDPFSVKSLNNFDKDVLKKLKFFIPEAISCVLEDSTRGFLADELTKIWHKAIIVHLEKIFGEAWYCGELSDGTSKTVDRVKFSVSSVLANVGSEFIELTIENPEHFVNQMIKVEGRFLSNEIKIDIPATNSELHNRILNALSIYEKERSPHTLKNVPFKLSESYTEEDVIERLKEISLESLEDEISNNFFTLAKQKGNVDQILKDLKEGLEGIDKKLDLKILEKNIYDEIRQSETILEKIKKLN